MGGMGPSSSAGGGIGMPPTSGNLPMDPAVAAAMAAMQAQHQIIPPQQAQATTPVVHTPSSSSPAVASVAAAARVEEKVKTRLPEVPTTFLKLDSMRLPYTIPYYHTIP
jgi:hypothetical protein